MAKTRKETTITRIGRLIRCAIVEAAIGNESEARGFIKADLKAGVTLDPHIEKGIEIAITKGINDRKR